VSGMATPMEILRLFVFPTSSIFIREGQSARRIRICRRKAAASGGCRSPCPSVHVRMELNARTSAKV